MRKTIAIAVGRNRRVAAERAAMVIETTGDTKIEVLQEITTGVMTRATTEALQERRIAIVTEINTDTMGLEIEAVRGMTNVGAVLVV